MPTLNDFSSFNDLVFPKGTLLGNLYIEEVFQFYDVPLCFSSRNEIGHRFLSTLIDFENPAEPKWFLVPMSDVRFSEVRSGAMDLRTAFSKPELGFLFITSCSELYKVGEDRIAQELLPAENARIEIKTHSLTRKIDALDSYARSAGREALDISFENDKYKKTVYPIKLLAQNLRAIQDVVDTLPLDKASPSASKGRIAQASLSETELGLTDLYAASFGTRLVSLSSTNVLFGDTTIGKTLGTFLTLFEAASDESRLRTILSALSKRTVTKFLSLLKILAFSETSVRVAMAIPGRAKRESALTYRTAGSLVQMLTKLIDDEPLEYDLDGVLVGLHSDRKTFYINYEKDGKHETMSGQVLDPEVQREEYASINAHYRFRVREIESYNPLTDETKYDYFLLKLLKIGTANT